MKTSRELHGRLLQPAARIGAHQAGPSDGAALRIADSPRMHAQAAQLSALTGAGPVQLGSKKADKEADKERRKKQEQQKQAQQKEQMNKREAERMPARQEAADQAQVKQQKLALKQAKVEELVRTFNQQVSAVAQSVRGMRVGLSVDAANRINAGTNPGLATVPGGTGNPLTFDLKDAGHGITGADVFPNMTGFDSSDSGLFKFRIPHEGYKNILVHGQT